MRRMFLRIDLWDSAFAIASLVSFAYLLYLGHQNTFWHDEWRFLNSRLGWDIGVFMRPHNEHWVLGIALVWKPLLATVGLSNYVPYLAVTLLLHIVTAAAVYRMARFLAGPAFGLGFGVLYLFLGSGAENLFWAFQMGFVGAAAAGAWALASFLEGRRLRLVALLLVISIATSGPGLFFISSIVAVVLVSPGRMRQAWVILPALFAFGGWLITYGHGALAGDKSWALGSAPYLDYIRLGISTAVGNTTGLGAVGTIAGLGTELGLILAILLIGATLWNLLAQKPVNEAAAAGVAGLISVYAISGLVRTQIEVTSSEASRYTYVAAIFVLLGIAAWLPKVERPNRQMLVPFVTLIFWAMTLNFRHLGFWHTFFLNQAETTAAAIKVSLRYGGSPAVPLEKTLPETTPFWLASLPSPVRIRALTTRYGYPAKELSVPPEIFQRVLFNYVQESMKISSADRMLGSAPVIADSSGITINQSGDCLRITPIGVAPTVTMIEPGAAIVYVRSEIPSETRVYLSQSGSFTKDASTTLLSGPRPSKFVVPDLGDGSGWHIRLDTSQISSSDLCVLQGGSP
jgi:hypothetical protein